MKGNVVITGGGTGGHLKVADAFIEEFNKRGIPVIFIGSSNGQDKQWFDQDKRLKAIYFLDTKGVVNKNTLGKISSLLNIISKTNYCLGLFSKYNVKTVISVGGFSAAAATFASIVKPGCKLYIHEQNSVMGTLNKVTSRFATEVFSSFTNSSKIKDYPVAQEFFELGRIRDKVKTVAFFGGSQGAIAINDFALKVAVKLNEMDIKIIHQAGKNDYQRIKEEYAKLSIDADIFDFSKDIPSKMQKADFAVSRAGASTLWELCANCLPTFFIPYKYAAGDHQYYNAKDLKDRGLCFLQREGELKEEDFFNAINSDIHSISKSLASSINSNAVALICNIIIQNNKK
ncbi:UDP-N-acetylglucosamine--N-acetylmuramyl-(pentapeptide) pyrophosphoryl-undecaprenol N-acetylglucosamine transferase [Poseidonibacter lekithochrous]|uniref:UDP-N-acetylglucosamine--N-acetylmuramyl- (pentapeptide) pyrophosphoryl-undecaprenol N-acetylglucosamine transferase n=1 Tax=Poseidonibacter TaxID=2321187 RepID=UPI001C09B8B0|nr:MULTISPECIES: UDP-N-acetylglucosamine--N-acetylmuramyl-(pentapeptide) pyrophosphoryl-undecaprenol N-acetylglucosamine transferase [Poseidonibacter]MBU3015430.1 UDP-N-acetylglucosamine--N-acetylmuramyl-(pentapeptide) pyrophosphoryl-undecaprenol N-acetylglucosamine transferase [Poseidonibacter lekithochrous]MDO6828729.1 UDP-N-acetylglucosamine--N-acetylmuramyl-(pentapeptide) pyrophosphoryl-undecaprenol N-acetylglucosamine transferase [Poseidonibacter sp. 1_MG-2023]